MISSFEDFLAAEDTRPYKVGESVTVDSPGTWADGQEAVVIRAGGPIGFTEEPGGRQYTVAIGDRNFEANYYELEAVND